jgi:predicted RNA-binding Zn-ribbon protein involved in translation (DUF1610 family)
MEFKERPTAIWYAMEQGYLFKLDRDGNALVEKIDGTVYHIVDWACDCPDALFRNGSYEGACKHVHWLAQLFPCGLCDGVMIFSPYYRVFECPDCGEKYRLDAILKQRAARLEKRQAA